MTNHKAVVPIDRVERAILVIRGRKVILDADLAELYGVSTKRLKEQVKRNKERFPADFMFLLDPQEVRNLRSQFATSSVTWGGTRYPPMAFTEHGAIMAASVLNTQRAVEASIYVVRAFVKIREMLSTHKELAQKLAELERKVVSHDEHIQSLFAAIRRLMAPPEPMRRRIGFQVRETRVRYGRGLPPRNSPRPRVRGRGPG